MLNIKRTDKILDFACGTGLNISYFIKKVPAKNIIGIDYSKSMLKVAKTNYPYVKFIRADISRYLFKKKFDKIVSTYSISMIDNWKEAIVNAKNSLKKDGVFIILDFYPWKGVVRVGYPLFRWWLSKQGVNPEKKIISFLKKHFKKVDFDISRLGYNIILVASEPKI